MPTSPLAYAVLAVVALVAGFAIGIGNWSLVFGLVLGVCAGVSLGIYFTVAAWEKSCAQPVQEP